MGPPCPWLRAPPRQPRELVQHEDENPCDQHEREGVSRKLPPNEDVLQHGRQHAARHHHGPDQGGSLEDQHQRHAHQRRTEAVQPGLYIRRAETQQPGGERARHRGHQRRRTEVQAAHEQADQKEQTGQAISLQHDLPQAFQDGIRERPAEEEPVHVCAEGVHGNRVRGQGSPPGGMGIPVLLDWTVAHWA